MFARITSYQMNPATLDVAKAMVNEIKSEVMALPGMHEFINAVDDETGRGYVISLVESREVSDANADKVMAIWGKFADHLTAKPEPEGMDVYVHWRN